MQMIAVCKRWIGDGRMGWQLAESLAFVDEM
jgi:hypothetical protein